MVYIDTIGFTVKVVVDLHVCSCYNDNPSLALLRSSAHVFGHVLIVYDGYVSF